MVVRVALLALSECLLKFVVLVQLVVVLVGLR